MVYNAAISFPNLGIEIDKLDSSFSIFGFEIAFYGLIIGLGILLGALLSLREAKLTNQNPDDYIDLALYGVIFAIIGARLYYVIFQFGTYKDDLLSIFNLRNGGLAIYGGIIAAVITAYVVAKKKKIPFMLMADTAVLGLITGQIIGRWGNFFNREAFGGDTNGLFAMKIDTWDKEVNVGIPKGVSFIDNNDRYIQVQPTFLYESFLNLLLLIFIMVFRKKKKYNGEIFLIYLFGYGIIRAFVESMRTDQLLIPNTNLAVSLVLSVIISIVTGVLLVKNRLKAQ